MQPDLRWLVAGLGLGASSLALVGCDEGPKQTAPTATLTAVPIGSDGERIHPPEGKWCAKPEVAKSLVILGSPEVDGCMKFLDGERIPKEKELAPEYIDMPRSTYGFYDDIQTKMRRSAINHAPLCCYNWREKAPGGRPLVDPSQAAVALIAPLVSEHATPEPTLQLLSPPVEALPSVLAHWRRQAQLEHSSVASFTRARLELIALGAPRELVRRYAEAALDELQHTALCLEVLHAWGAPALAFGALQLARSARTPPSDRALALRTLAQRTLDEAFEPEAAAAVALHNAAGRSACPELRAVLASIALDERRHARLALDTVLWCLEESKPATVRLTSPSASNEARSVAVAGAREFGVISDADWLDVRTRCRAPLAAALAARA
ncbi:MAG: hypothetical protein H6718_03950 [Polyangiaceae bacterium]|nr:hypothetical protein [Myxococcales bacterium]MCB9584521.1 hypothetical protein [Polyangiaceae bacterium]